MQPDVYYKILLRKIIRTEKKIAGFQRDLQFLRETMHNAQKLYHFQFPREKPVQIDMFAS